MQLRFPLIAIALLWSGLVIAQDAQYRLAVNGLACPFCAYGIEKKLESLDGVDTVDIQLNEGVVVVTMEQGATLSEDRAREAVSEAGFTLNGFEAVGPSA